MQGVLLGEVMRVIDLGHVYELEWLDEDGADRESLPYLQFVKREGPKYPGNTGHHAGTNMQEVLRVLIHRMRYVHGQQWDFNNTTILNDLRHALYLLEERAARKHNRTYTFSQLILQLSSTNMLEDLPTCKTCGHIGCEGTCRDQREEA